MGAETHGGLHMKYTNTLLLRDFSPSWNLSTDVRETAKYRIALESTERL
jgi:hypothetical protein